MGTKNPVAKHARTYNKATVEDDRKKKNKKGYRKHKQSLARNSEVFSFMGLHFRLVGIL